MPFNNFPNLPTIIPPSIAKPAGPANHAINIAPKAFKGFSVPHVNTSFSTGHRSFLRNSHIFGNHFIGARATNRPKASLPQLSLNHFHIPLSSFRFLKWSEIPFKNPVCFFSFFTAFLSAILPSILSSTLSVAPVSFPPPFFLPKKARPRSFLVLFCNLISVAVSSFISLKKSAIVSLQ